MMKVYRPLCSDVTLRLTVDISPDGDEQEDLASHFQPDTLCACSNRDNNNARGEKCMSCLDNNALRTCHAPELDNSHHNNHSHSHSQSNQSCVNAGPQRQHGSHGSNWYARHNTPDKIAKDIYNTEHLLQGSAASTEGLRTRRLEEFKRSVEEEGNDFKDVTFFGELGRDAVRPDGYGTTGGHPQQHQLYKYSDAKLSVCHHDNNQCHGLRQSSGRGENIASGKGSESNGHDHYGIDPKGSNAERNDDDDDKEEDEIDVEGVDEGGEEEEEEEEEEETFDSPGKEATSKDDGDEDTVSDCMDVDEDFDENVDMCRVPEPLTAVDLDEDVEFGDKQIMTASMIQSFYGEMDDAMVTVKPGTEVESLGDEMSKSIAEEIHDVLRGDDPAKSDDVFVPGQDESGDACQLPFPYPFTLKHAGHLFDKSRHRFTAASKSSRRRTPSSRNKSASVEPCSPRDNVQSTSSPTDTPQPVSPRVNLQTVPSLVDPQHSAVSPPSTSSVGQTASSSIVNKQRKHSRCRSVSPVCSTSSTDLEVTHRGLHRFIPRHKDEITIGIGDPIHVIKECDDLWCEGINLRTNERGVFPAVYANDLTFLEESDDEDEYWKFSMRFLGSLEVTSNKGDTTLVQAIQKVAVAHKENVRAAPCSSLEISQYGIRMIDKSKEGHEKDAFSHFFALKNISFCGTHPKDNRYFAFITKHPRDYRFACHVFYGDRPTHRARDALGEAFKRFYQEYMAFTHPTEDIYIE